MVAIFRLRPPRGHDDECLEWRNISYGCPTAVHPNSEYTLRMDGSSLLARSSARLVERAADSTILKYEAAEPSRSPSSPLDQSAFAWHSLSHDGLNNNETRGGSFSPKHQIAISHPGRMLGKRKFQSEDCGGLLERGGVLRQKEHSDYDEGVEEAGLSLLFAASLLRQRESRTSTIEDTLDASMFTSSVACLPSTVPRRMSTSLSSAVFGDAAAVTNSSIPIEPTDTDGTSQSITDTSELTRSRPPC